MGVLLQGFFFGPGRVHGVPSPLDGDGTIPFWWDHLATQAHEFRRSGFTAIWLPPPLKGASGSFSSGYDVFDDYDLGSKDQKGTIPTRYGTREQLERCVAMMRANGIDVYVDMVENQRDGDDQPVTICRIFTEAQRTIEARFFFDISDWAENTIVHLELLGTGGARVVQLDYKRSTPQGTALKFDSQQKGFHTFRLQSANAPPQNKMPTYRLQARYSAPQRI